MLLPLAAPGRLKLVDGTKQAVGPKAQGSLCPLDTGRLRLSLSSKSSKENAAQAAQTTPWHTQCGLTFILPQARERGHRRVWTGTARCAAGRLTAGWPRGLCGPRRASKGAESEKLTVFFPGVTKAVLLESCCLVLINEDHQTSRKRNPTGEVKTMY